MIDVSNCRSLSLKQTLEFLHRSWILFDTSGRYGILLPFDSECPKKLLKKSFLSSLMFKVSVGFCILQQINLSLEFVELIHTVYRETIKKSDLKQLINN